MTKYLFSRSALNIWASMYHFFVDVCCSSNVVVIERHIKRLLCKSLYSIIESMKISQKIHRGDIYPIEYHNSLFKKIWTQNSFLYVIQQSLHISIIRNVSFDCNIFKDSDLSMRISKICNTLPISYLFATCFNPHKTHFLRNK